MFWRNSKVKKIKKKEYNIDFKNVTKYGIIYGIFRRL